MVIVAFICLFCEKLVLKRIWMQVFMRRRGKPKRRKPEKTVWCKKGEKSDFIRWRWSFFTGKPENAVNWMQKYANPRKQKANIPTFLIFYQLNKSSGNIFLKILWWTSNRAMFRKSTKEFYFQVLDLFQNFPKTKMMMVDFWYIVWGHTGRGAAWES